MRALSARDVLQVWEAGRDRHPVDRALLVLGAALPRTSRDELAALSVGERDALLLAVRERTLGPRLSCFVKCPTCAVPLEFSAEVGEVRLLEPGVPVAREHALAVDGWNVRFRLVDSRDLAALAGERDPAFARRLLLSGCVLEALRGGEPVAPRRVPEPVLAAVAAAMVQHDPQSEIEFSLACHACGTRWGAMLDVAAFLWTELSSLAKRLMREVHALAAAYGWREADILAMSAARRAAYLEMVGG
jgi:hypothetical protein